MRFRELCDLLIQETGAAPVYFARYPSLGTAGSDVRPEVIILERDDGFEVGSEDADRGSWVSGGVFPTEEEAFAYTLRLLTAASPKPVRRASGERARSAEANERFVLGLRTGSGDSGG